MEGTGTGATAMLVGSPKDVGERPDAATVTMAREEIEEALASDEPLELILSVKPGDSDPRDVRVAWQRSDLETVLAGIDSGAVTFSFDRAELYRALENPDFEGHGIREMVLLTVAAASASAALAASTASGQPLADGPGEGVAAAAVAPGHGEATTARDLGAAGVVVPGHDEAKTAGALAASAIHDEATPAARGVGQTIPGADEATLAEQGVDVAIATAMGNQDATTARDLATPAIHDEATPAARGVGQTIPGADEATLAEQGVDVAIATAMGNQDATTARDLATPAIHDEATPAARGIGQTIPGADEATLAERGVDVAIATAIGNQDATTARDLATPATADSGTSFDLPSVDTGTAAAIGALAGAGLLIVGAAFAARRRVTPV